MSPANKAENKWNEVPGMVKRGKTITIEIDSEVSDLNLNDGEMSPAYIHTRTI